MTGVLPSFSARPLDRLVGVLLGGDAADDLDQLHRRHRVHEVHADEALGPVGDRRQPGDRDRGGVAGDDRARAAGSGSRLGEDLALELLVLGRGLDHQVAVARTARMPSPVRDPAQRRGLVGLARARPSAPAGRGSSRSG